MQLTKHLSSAAALVGMALILAFWSNSAFADKRVALVIGNSNYKSVPKLSSPQSDAKAIAQMFQNAGFDTVDLEIDAASLDFKRAIRKFAGETKDATMAVVFFAGRGIEQDGTNYLIPVDSVLARERDVPDEAIALDRIVEAVRGATQLRLVIVDACRDNPFYANAGWPAALRTVSRGLARVEPNSADMLIAFAAKAGATSQDGQFSHSPFTTAILDNLTVPGVDIRLAFGRVRDEVMKITNSKQEPFVYGSLGDGVISLVPQPAQPIEPEPTDVKADYELVREIGTRKAWEVFLSTYKTGFYATLAAAELAKLSASEEGGSQVPVLEVPQGPRLNSIQQLAEEQATKEKADEAKRQAQLAEAKRQADEMARQAQLAEVKRQADEMARQAQLAEAKRQADEIARQAQLAEAKRQADEMARQAQLVEAKRQADEMARQAQLAEAKRQADEIARQAQLAEAKRQADEMARQAQLAEARRQADEMARQKAAQDAALAAAQQAAKAAAKIAADAEREAALKRDEDAYKATLAANVKRPSDNYAAILPVEQTAAPADHEAGKQHEDDGGRVKVAEAETPGASLVNTALPSEPGSPPPSLKDAAVPQSSLTPLSTKSTGLDDNQVPPAGGFKDVVGPNVDEARPQKTLKQSIQEMSNSPELIRAAQIELSRLGCYSGEADGLMSTSTTDAVSRYLSHSGRLESDTGVTESFVSELRDQHSKVCGLSCPTGQSTNAATCVAGEKPSKPKEALRQDDEPSVSSKKGGRSERLAESRRSQQVVSAYPREFHSGGGNVIGVGF